MCKFYIFLTNSFNLKKINKYQEILDLAEIEKGVKVCIRENMVAVVSVVARQLLCSISCDRRAFSGPEYLAVRELLEWWTASNPFQCIINQLVTLAALFCPLFRKFFSAVLRSGKLSICRRGLELWRGKIKGWVFSVNFLFSLYAPEDEGRSCENSNPLFGEIYICTGATQQMTALAQTKPRALSPIHTTCAQLNANRTNNELYYIGLFKKWTKNTVPKKINIIFIIKKTKNNWQHCNFFFFFVMCSCGTKNECM